MTSNFEIVRYRPDLKKQVVELQTHLWSPSLALNIAYFEWKYERNPYVKTPLIYLAMHNGRAVGMRGFFGVQWEGGVPTQKVAGLYADDMVIVPEHRNSGVMTRIMTTALEDLKEQGHDYVFNLSAGPLVHLSSLFMGWSNVGFVQTMRRRSWKVAFQDGLQRVLERLPLNSQDIDMRVSRWAAKVRGSLTDISQNKAGSALKTFSRVSFQDAPRCEAMAELVSRIDGSGRIRHVRDSEYFNWRFQNPLSRYRFLFWEKERLEGYLVLQEYTSEFANHEMANIVDWEATNVTVQAELLRAAIALSGAGNMIVWSATLGSETTELLVQSGFRPVKRPRSMAGRRASVLVRPLREKTTDDWLLAGQRLLTLESWDLRMLYSMWG